MTCTFSTDEHALQLTWFQRHLADRTGHLGRAFQLRPEHRLEGLLPAARDPAARVFAALGIRWHSYIGHARSSQAACVNFLMPFADKPELLARWVGSLLGTRAPVMLPLEKDAAGAHRFVAFEYTGPNDRDWLGEAEGGVPQRALLLIEWKYSEEYRGHRLSADRKGKRIARYGDKTFAPNGPIRADLGLALADFFHEPFYQLLRQQMLAWQIERAGVFDRVRVLHLSPAGNRALHAVTAPALRRIGGVAHTDAFAAYHATLSKEAAFIERSIEQAFAPLAGWLEAEWWPALTGRYPTLCTAEGLSARQV